MPFSAKLLKHNFPASTGNFNASGGGAGFVPDLRMLQSVGSPFDTEQNRWKVGQGFVVSDAIEAAIGTVAENTDKVSSYRLSASDSCLLIPSNTGGTVQEDCNFISHDASTSTYNAAATAGVTANRFTDVAFGGLTGMSLDWLTAPGSTGNQVNPAGLSSAPDLVGLFSVGGTATDPMAPTLTFRHCIGWATADDQFSISQWSRNPGEWRRQDDATIFNAMGGGSGAVWSTAALTMTASGFDLNWTVAGVAWKILAVSIWGPQCKIIKEAAPASTGSQVLSGIGFTPKYHGVYGMGSPTLRTTLNDLNMFVGHSAGATEQSVMASYREKASPYKALRYQSDSDVVRAYNSSGVIDQVANHTGFGAGSSTLSRSAVVAGGDVEWHVFMGDNGPSNLAILGVG